MAINRASSDKLLNPKNLLLLREVAAYPRQALGCCTDYVPPPVEAALFVTRRCNSRCSMCDFWKQQRHDNELTTEEVLSCIRQFKELGGMVVSLSAAGELFLRSDCVDIMEAVSDANLLFSINSNFLYLSQELADAIARLRPYQTTVGIDTLRPEKYRDTRGIKDGVELVRKSIQKLRDRGYTDIVLGAVVLHNNLEDLLELVAYVQETGLKGVRFTAFQPSGFGKEWSDAQLALYRKPEFIQKLKRTIETLISEKHNGAPVLNSEPYLRMIPQSYVNKFFFPVACKAPWRRINIHPGGEVSLCEVMEDSAVIGNMRESWLKELWYSKQAARVRDTVKKKTCGGCWLSCYAETNLRFSGRYLLSTVRNGLSRFRRL